MNDRELVRVTIDGIDLDVPPGTNIVDAARGAGIEIPVFCHHPRLEPVGMCRMCLVELGLPVVDRATGQPQRDADGRIAVRFGPHLGPACTTVAVDGMVVRTQTEAVATARSGVLEMLLTSHPLDCPVCDKGGECPLQNQTLRFGPGMSRFEWSDKARFAKPVPIGPLIVLDRERCVLCARCIRFADEIAGDPVLGFARRARAMEVVSFSDPPFASLFSGNTTDICPVGALTTVDFRFQARVWELSARPGVCTHCAVGCNVMFDTRDGHVERVMPRRNEAVNDLWICDKGRFAYHFVHDPRRLTTPLVRRDGQLVTATWDEALDEVAAGVDAARAAGGGAAIGGIAGAEAPNEDLYAFGRFLRAVVGTPNVDHCQSVVRDDCVARWGIGAREVGAGGPIDLARLGAGAAVVVVGLDVEAEAPVLLLQVLAARRRGARVIVVSGRPQKLDGHADSLLRWHYGDEARPIARLLSAALDRLPHLPDGAVSLRANLGAAADLASAPEQTDDEGAHRAADAVLGDAARVAVLYGREATLAGLARPLSLLVRAIGARDGVSAALVAVGQRVNAQGAADMGLLPDRLPGCRSLADGDARQRMSGVWRAPVAETPGRESAAMLAGGGVRMLFVLGADPLGDGLAVGDRIDAPDAVDMLVVQDTFLTETARRAHVVLPLQSPLERSGTFTSLARRVQHFAPVVAPVGQAWPAWEMLAALAARLGAPLPWRCAGDVTNEIARVVPGYAAAAAPALAAVAPTDLVLPFAPGTEARAVSYLGAAYVSDEVEGGVVVAHDATPLDAHDPDWAWPAASPRVRADLALVPIACLIDARPTVTASQVLRPLVPDPYVEMHPSDAASRCLVGGSRVRLSTARGSVVADLRLREDQVPGVVTAPEGLAWRTPVRALTGGAHWVNVAVEGSEA